MAMFSERCVGIFLHELEILFVPFGVRHKHVWGEAPDFNVGYLKLVFLISAQTGIPVGRTGTGGTTQKISLEDDSKSVTVGANDTPTTGNLVVRKELTEVVLSRPRIDIDNIIISFQSGVFFVFY